jgi:hypothetical protein
MAAVHWTMNRRREVTARCAVVVAAESEAGVAALVETREAWSDSFVIFQIFQYL